MSLIRRIVFHKNLIVRMIPRNPILYTLFKRYISKYNGENNINMYKNGEIRFLKCNIKNCKVVFDIGANIGQWTRIALNMNKDLNIHCFEPSKYTYTKLLSKNFPPNVNCINIGLSSTKKEQILYIFREGGGLNSLYQREGLYNRNKKLSSKKEKVQLDTLDNYCDEKNIQKIDFMKIDAEGHEFEILKGGKNLFHNGQVNLIQFEYGGCFIDAHVFLKDIFDFFKDFDYNFYKIYPNSIKLVPKYFNNFENFQYQNWLIIKKEHKFFP
ncbi:MAG: FkbM family methyltransferase [Promethearchaeota archaeon]